MKAKLGILAVVLAAGLTAVGCGGAARLDGEAAESAEQAEVANVDASPDNVAGNVDGAAAEAEAPAMDADSNPYADTVTSLGEPSCKILCGKLCPRGYWEFFPGQGGAYRHKGCRSGWARACCQTVF